MSKLKRKLLSLLMTAAMITTLFAGMTISASATETVSTQAQLAAMTSGNYVLGANITIDASTWTPISNFTGTFDGDSSNYKITWDGVYASRTWVSYAGSAAYGIDTNVYYPADYSYFALRLKSL